MAAALPAAECPAEPAYRRDGLEADAEVRSSTFARLSVSSSKERAKVELGVDWRKNEPILLAVGPVLHADDAVANKVCALFRSCRAITTRWIWLVHS